MSEAVLLCTVICLLAELKVINEGTAESSDYKIVYVNAPHTPIFSLQAANENICDGE